MEAYGGPAQPPPTIAQGRNGGLGWLEVECNRCKTRASLPLDAIRRPRSTPIWKLEASLKCRSCRKGNSAGRAGAGDGSSHKACPAKSHERQHEGRECSRLVDPTLF